MLDEQPVSPASNETPAAPRRNRARERHMRRQQRKQGMTTTRPTRVRRAVPLSDSGGFSLSDVDLRLLRAVVIGVGAVVFMISVILAVGLFKNEPVEADPNALWIGTEWTYQVHEDDAVRDFVRLLREHEIATLYAQVSDLNFDSSWTGRPDLQNQFEEVRPEVAGFVAQIRRFYPEVTLYGVLGIRADLAADSYRLDEERLQRVVADFSTQVIASLGFDGVLLNVEPVWNGDTNYLALLRRVRQGIGQEALLAIATPPDWTPVDADVPTPAVIAAGTVWDTEYKQRVALIRPDQIVIRSYNSYLTDANEYAEWVTYQVRAYVDAISPLQIDTQLMIGVPTYDNDLPAHDVAVENVLSALIGIRRAVSGLTEEEALLVRGLALYAEWTTDTGEWSQFKSQWIDRS
ncbi:MAG: hypothetical protein OHK0046_40820 [Anaerolineae bacterium]